jgi:hypothetical protein
MRSDNNNINNPTSKAKAQREAKARNRHRFGNGVDPREAGRKGALARLQSTTPEQRSIIAHNAQAARVAKYRKRLMGTVPDAIEALRDIVTRKGDPARANAAKAILDRSGFGPGSSITIEGEISGELIHRTQCLDVDRLPLIVKRMMAAALESEWEPSPELTEKIRAELPMLQVKIESSKPVKGSSASGNVSITNGSGTTPGNGITHTHGITHGSGYVGQSINRAITGAVTAGAARHQDQERDADQEDD